MSLYSEAKYYMSPNLQRALTAIQSVFADGTYSKPYLITYLNIAFFILPLGPGYLERLYQTRYPYEHYNPAGQDTSSASYDDSDDPNVSSQPLMQRTLEHDDLPNDSPPSSSPTPHSTQAQKHLPPLPLSPRATLNLAAQFSALWFLANWLNAASYTNTSVASSTILVSTSSVFTLLMGVVARTERFTFNKLVGVLASLVGIALISLVDTGAGSGGGSSGADGSVGDGTGKDDDNSRGSFPYKSPSQIALGDGMALASAVLYGLYATLITARIGDERRINMPLFFGFIGAVAIITLWPGLGILHLAGWEPFALPPTKRVWTVVLVNAALSLVADMCWAYAVLLTSPLVVTVGLTLTIPLSLVGQIVVNGQYAGLGIWVGAVVVVGGFVLVNWEVKAGRDARVEGVGKGEEVGGREVGEEERTGD